MYVDHCTCTVSASFRGRSPEPNHTGRTAHGTVAAALSGVLTAIVFSASLLVPRQVPAQPAAPASTDHRLVGTVEGSAFSGAVFIDPAGQQQFYRVGEMLPDGSRLIAVRQESVLVKRPDGMTYEVFIYRELRTAVPASPAPSVDNLRGRDKRDETERKRSPRRFRRSAEETPDE